MKRAFILTIAVILSLVLSAGSAGSLFDLAIPAAPPSAEEPSPTPEPESPSADAKQAPASPEQAKAVSSPEEECHLCPDCDRGRCRMCDGRGYTDCNLCFGSGICGVCMGKPQKYVPGYGAGGTYVTCCGCNGSARCSFCGGTGRKDCIWCDGGVCRKCQGDYLHGQ